MGRHVCYGILGYLRMLHDRFKFTAFDTLLRPDAETEETYGLSNVLNTDLFALLYTAMYTMYLCENAGVVITKEKFIPLLKNNSLFMVRYFRSLCVRELAKFSVVRSAVTSRGGNNSSLTLSSARKLTTISHFYTNPICLFLNR